MNWAIGCIGRRDRTARYFDTGPILTEGGFDSHGTPVAPQSLYLAQLAERLGPGALPNLGYAANRADEFTNKTVPCLPAWLETDLELGPNLAFHRPIDASARGRTREFGGEKAVDGNDQTYWAVDDGVARPSLIIDLEGPAEIDTVVLEEALGLGPRVQSYQVEGFINSEFKVLSQGTTIGRHKVDQFSPVTVWKVRLTILQSDGSPGIRNIGLYQGAKPRSARSTGIR
jgi:hypothetical protein